jgi:hypothetical protein
VDTRETAFQEAAELRHCLCINGAASLGDGWNSDRCSEALNRRRLIERDEVSGRNGVRSRLEQACTGDENENQNKENGKQDRKRALQESSLISTAPI